jgi:hypothetical protein
MPPRAETTFAEGENVLKQTAGTSHLRNGLPKGPSGREKMSGTGKAVLAAALIAFGLVIGEDIARGTAPTPFLAQDMASDALTVQEAALRERALRTLKTLLENQANGATAEPPDRPKCHEQTWPYYSNHCLARSNGEPVFGAVRIVRFERSANGS